MANQTDTTKQDSKDKTSINTLPEYKIRTMKRDLAKKGLVIAPPEKLPIAPEDKPARAPLPSTEELISEKKLPKEPKPVPKPAPKIEKPKVPIIEKKADKKPKFLIFAIIIILILIAVGVFFYLQGTKPEPPTPPEEDEGQAEPEQLIPSASLISVDEVKMLSLSPETSVFNLLKQEVEASQLINTFKRIVILNPSTDKEQEFLSLKELFQKLEIPVPPYTLLELKQDYTLVLYNQTQGKRLGLITQVKNSGNLKTQLIAWEQTMLDDFKNFYIDDQPGEKETQMFQDDNYKETAIRYINLPDPYLTLNYTILNDLFIIGTSKELMYTIIDKIKM